MNNYKDNLSLFQNALLDASLEKEKKILEEDREDPVFSPAHKKAMKLILAGKNPKEEKAKRERILRRVLVAAAVAALLIFGSLGVAAKKNHQTTIMEYIRGVFNIASFDSEDGQPETIENIRIPTYFPEGYKLADVTSTPDFVYRRWHISDDVFITFEQRIMGMTAHSFDSRYKGYQKFKVGKQSVNYKVIGQSVDYVWTDGEYAYTMLCPESVSQEEAALIIGSIR